MKSNNKKETTALRIPPHEMERLARCLLPEIHEFFASEKGKKEFEEWKRQQKNKK